jgi:hypothetical protein
MAGPEDKLEICVTMTHGDVTAATHMNPFDSVQDASSVEGAYMAHPTEELKNTLQNCVTTTDE